MCFSFLFPKYPREFKAEVERLTENLISIGKKEDYLSVRSGGPFDQNCRHKDAREIGNRFFEIGGIPLMEDRVRLIRRKVSKEGAAHLEACWRAVGGIF